MARGPGSISKSAARPSRPRDGWYDTRDARRLRRRRAATAHRRVHLARRHAPAASQSRPCGQALDVAYALTTEWPAAVLERSPSPRVTGLESWQHPVLEGRWIRGINGYELQVDIDVAAPSVIYIRSQRLLSHVPFVGRPPARVEDALNVELASYVNAFLSQCQPVPQAAALDAQRLRQLVLAA